MDSGWNHIFKPHNVSGKANIDNAIPRQRVTNSLIRQRASNWFTAGAAHVKCDRLEAEIAAK